MPRYGRYLRLEKNIATSDTGGILERWSYGRRLLSDESITHPNGRLKHGELGQLVGGAKKGGYEVSEYEIQRRMQCARTYETEAEVSHAVRQFRTWHDLVAANFPAVELPEGADLGKPYDPRDADEKTRDANAELERLKKRHPAQEALFDWNPAYSFKGDERGPRSTFRELYADLDASERWTAGMVKFDAERRAYVDECFRAAGSNLDATWFEGERRLQAAKEHFGVSDLASLDEILDDWYGRNRE